MLKGRRTNKGWALVGQSKYAEGKMRRYCVESWSASPLPTGKVDPACITLSNQDGGPPIHHIYCDQMQRLTTDKPRCIVIELVGGNTAEIVCEEDKDWRRWTKHIALLLSIPLYPIPDELNLELPSDLLNGIDPKFYDPRGVMAWGLYVLQDGIGAMASLKNAPCVAVITEDDQIKIFPWKVTSSQIVWDRNKLRRSGSIGDLVFLEAGRRCRHGPGLLWMCTKSDVALSLREGLHTFLFKGNKAVAVSTRRDSQVSISSQRSSGVDVSFDSGVHHITPERSTSGVFCRQSSTLSSSDSVTSDSGIGKSRSPDFRPQVPLHTHPSLRRKHYSSRHSGHSFNEGDSPEPDEQPHSSTVLVVPHRQHSQFSEDLFDLEDGGVSVEERRSSPPQEVVVDQQYVVMSSRGSCSPPKAAPQEEYERMTSKWSSAGPSSEQSGLHYPQNQEKLMNGMCIYDNAKLKPVGQPQAKSTPLQNGVSGDISNYDNCKLKPGLENYVNTAIKHRVH